MQEHDDETVEEAPAKPAKSDWTPIDLSHGTFKDKELYKAGAFRQGLRKELGGIPLRAAQKKEVTNLFMKKRSRGLGRQEIKRGLRDLKEQGKLSSFQVKKLRRKFGAF